MKCHQASDLIPALTGVDLPGDGEWSALREHVASCPSCQSQVLYWQGFDRVVQQTVVAVPVGFKERLLGRLPEMGNLPTVSLTSSETNPTVSLPSSESRQPVPKQNRSTWQRILATAASVLLFLGIGYLFLPPGQKPLLISEYLNEVTAPSFSAEGEVPDWIATELPDDILVPSSLANAHGLLTRDGLAVAYEFQVENPPLSALLLVIDTNRVKVLDPEVVGKTFMTAEVHYRNRIAARVWQRDELIYICFVRTRGPASLDRLIQPFDAT